MFNKINQATFRVLLVVVLLLIVVLVPLVVLAVFLVIIGMGGAVVFIVGVDGSGVLLTRCHSRNLFLCVFRRL